MKAGFRLNLEKKETENKTIRFPVSLIDKIDGYLGKMEKNLVDYLYKELYFSTTFEQYRSF